MKSKLNILYLPAFLLALWLLLNNSLSAGNIVLGLGLGLLLGVAALPFRPVRASIKKPLVALRLLWHVFCDIVHSNIDVGRIVWKGSNSGATPGFLDIPLTITDPHGLAALACIVTYTPGTVWSGFDEKNHVLTLHVLDLKDEQQWLDTIQKRYQNPLIEIFE
ncbi:Na+/H+ antiporter subunit E [Paenalcaligenes niemegkensis]|uniref:Na+/H+ antiporter subunit E n=1 Tax=Paenalcaligenes niemegkensis TaxID=2895469 RepID=UPI001EE93366|nr:Na+/H+ antiporter subunit E [Paenalcaligenes niemegkensis]MCQ9616132.1 Na+/H+ antiporter subunit E [Paenalcaligenes niemegkensis]